MNSCAVEPGAVTVIVKFRTDPAVTCNGPVDEDKKKDCNTVWTGPLRVALATNTFAPVELTSPNEAVITVPPPVLDEAWR